MEAWTDVVSDVTGINQPLERVPGFNCQPLRSIVPPFFTLPEDQLLHSFTSYSFWFLETPHSLLNTFKMFNFILFATFIFCISQLICSSAAINPPVCPQKLDIRSDYTATTNPLLKQACVLACVNEQPTPSAYDQVCGSTDVRDCLASRCEKPGPAADYFQSICAVSGHDVGML